MIVLIDLEEIKNDTKVNKKMIGIIIAFYIVILIWAVVFK